MWKRRLVLGAQTTLIQRTLPVTTQCATRSAMPLGWDKKNVVMEVNGDTACKTYLVVCHAQRKAALIDPIKPRLSNYLGFLAYHNLHLEYALDSHTHADHITASFELARLTGAKVVLHKRAPAPFVDRHVDEGDEVTVGDVPIKIMYTPGHTPDSVTFYLPHQKIVMPGDLLLIGGTGRTDFAGGDAGLSYDSIQRVMDLTDDTIILPNHDYRGNHTTTVGHERRTNPRFANKTKEEYIHIMNNLGLPLPEKIMEALQTNMTATADNAMHFPTISQLNQIHQLGADLVHHLLYPAGGADHPERHQHHQKEKEFVKLFATELTDHEMTSLTSHPPVILDVRLDSEFHDAELGRLPGSINIPLGQLPKRSHELDKYKDRAVICVCRAGVRSTTASALLKGLGFNSVFNLKGGLLAWKEKFGHPQHKK